MSARTAPRFALVGLLAAILVGPAAAQNSPVVAPMPRPAGGVEVEFGIEFSSGPLAVPPMVPPPPLCAFDRGEVQILAEAPMPRAKGECDYRVAVGQGVRVLVPALGPLPLAFDPAAPCPTSGKPVQYWTVGMFGGDDTPAPACDHCRPAKAAATAKPTDLRVMYPLQGVTAIRRDENGTWWVEAQRIPQPKHALPTPVQFSTWQVGIGFDFNFPCNDPASQSVAPAAKAPCCGASGIDPDLTSKFLQLHLPVKHGPLTESALAGTWVRDMEGVVFAATFSGDELKLVMTQAMEGVAITLTLTADHALTKEGMVHGVVTGVDVSAKTGDKSPDVASAVMEMMEGAAMMQKLVDSPFCFRVKHTSAGVMVSNLKVGGIEALGVSNEIAPQLAILCGMYKPCKDGKIPAPKPMQPQVHRDLPLPQGQYLDHQPQYVTPDAVAPAPRPVGAPGCVQPCPVPLSGAGPYLAPPGCGIVRRVGSDGLERTGVDFESGPAALNLPLGAGFPPLPGQCPVPPPPGFSPQGGWTPGRPGNVPPGDFGMMAEVFGQMIGGNRQLPPPPMLTMPVPCQPMMVPPPLPGQPVMPAGAYAPPQSCPPCLPPSVVCGPQFVPPPAPPQPGQITRPIIGTWVREVGPVVYVVKIAPDHLTITASAACELDCGKIASEGIVLMADYHLARDGSTLVGLITGVDAVLDGPVPDDGALPQMGEELARIQKGMADKPFALGVRVYGDALVIGNVRLPEVDGPRGGWSPMAVLGGRYAAAGDRALPKPKPMKVGGPRQACPVPSIEVRESNPTLIPSQAVPLPAPRIESSVPQEPGAIPAPQARSPRAPLMIEPAPPAPPAPPVVAPDAPKTDKKGKKKKKADAPTVLTPEQIQGGLR